MTDKQRLGLYFPAWSRAWRANWERDGGQIARKAGRNCAELDRVEDIAAEIAMRKSCAVTADTLRHACHIAALGEDRSSTTFSNADLDAVLALFRVLADPDNLSARIALDHPEQDARRRLEWSVDHCGLPEAYVLAVSASKFGTKDWRGLNDVRLRQLMVTLKSRVKARYATAAADPEAVGAGNCPF